MLLVSLKALFYRCFNCFRLIVTNRREATSNSKTTMRFTDIPSPTLEIADSHDTLDYCVHLGKRTVARPIGSPAAGTVVANKTYNTNNVLTNIDFLRVQAVIPAQKARNLVPMTATCTPSERCFPLLKQAHAIATRYEKTALSFIAVTHAWSVNSSSLCTNTKLIVCTT
jgi:hypothetical protein